MLPNAGAGPGHPGWEAVVVVVTPQDAGWPTARSEPAEVAGGACRWAAPILEATKLPAARQGQDLGSQSGDERWEAAVVGDCRAVFGEEGGVVQPRAARPIARLLRVTLPRVASPALPRLVVHHELGISAAASSR